MPLSIFHCLFLIFICIKPRKTLHKHLNNTICSRKTTTSFGEWYRRSDCAGLFGRANENPKGVSLQTPLWSGAVLAFSCGDVLHEVAAAVETHLKVPGLRNFQKVRIASTAWTVLLGFASKFLSSTRSAHVSLRKRKGTNSEHAQPFANNNSQSLATLVVKVPQRDMFFQLSLHEIAGPALGRSPTQRRVALVLCFFGSPAPALAYRKRIVALPVCPLPFFLLPGHSFSSLF